MLGIHSYYYDELSLSYSNFEVMGTLAYPLQGATWVTFTGNRQFFCENGEIITICRISGPPQVLTTTITIHQCTNGTMPVF